MKIQETKPRPQGEPPLTRVHNLDRPNDRPRLIRLEAEDAVLYCMADEMGDPSNPDLYRQYLHETGAGWMCGHWWAKEETHG